LFTHYNQAQMSDATLTQPIICTIFARNYLAHVRILTDSFLAQHPGGRVYALLCDQLADSYNPDSECFTTIGMQDIGLLDLPNVAMKYNITEFCTAVKPFFLQYLFNKTSADSLCYFDPDILFLAPITDLLAHLQTDNIVLTPHLTVSYDDVHAPVEHGILATGAYNLGFIGLRRCEETDRFLGWSQRLLKYCYTDVARNYYVDQRWCDLAPGMFAGVHIERDPGCNVAYWNLSLRRVTRDAGAYMADGSPIKFFHFSGYTPRMPDSICRYQDRLSMSQIGDGARLFQEYGRRLLARGYEAVSGQPYAFAQFSNGVAINDIVRALWHTASDAGLHWDDPFDAAHPAGFYQWLIAPVDAGLPIINRVAQRVYEMRRDIHPIFPDLVNTYRRGYSEWFIRHGLAEHGLDPALGENMRQSLAAAPCAPLPLKAAARLRPWLLQWRMSRLGKRWGRSALAQAVHELFRPS
jgi:hypothetical protein